MKFAILLGLTLASFIGVECGPISSCSGNGDDKDVGGTTYTLFSCDLNWENARTKCNSVQKTLIKVSETLLSSLGPLASETFWTAATNRFKNDYSTWEWADYGESATAVANGQTDRRSCLAHEDGELVAKNCYTTTMNFVCASNSNPSQVGPRLNLAFSASANQINEASHASCAWRAVDEDTGADYEKNTCAQTLSVSNPWYVVGFGASKTVTEVAITGRAEPEQDQDVDYVAMSNFKVGVSNSFDWENFNPSDWTECATFPGELRSGERVSIPCAAQGAYVAVYIPGRTTSLQICNIEIY